MAAAVPPGLPGPDRRWHDLPDAQRFNVDLAAASSCCVMGRAFVTARSGHVNVCVCVYIYIYVV